ncbi:MAG: C40 family peptidase [Bacteroidia bacterium]|nr:C40 family peptidase [Bacteroidia bacterium]MBT8308999.1 C40 family peptidase [Bacteroidia bacterium]NNK28021.1 C40 family peptidase [Flavobacteriaceae bacterium]NNL60863.1 C40 family peptidase [Flavobacteriaceae bacterium]RZV65587.1 MAG: hydrolase Nlp/P60 [Flavobacteriaceae bacterium]
MRYGICNLSIVPLREFPQDSSEMISQILYGEHFKVLEKRKKWSRIRIAFDNYEGWVDNKQYLLIDKEQYTIIDKLEAQYSLELVDVLQNEKDQLLTLIIGSSVHSSKILEHKFEGKFVSGKQDKTELINTALTYMNAPYLWGGKTPFGIDCSGLTQMVYKINGYKLLRDASQQATQGDPLSFIDESEPGDLAFFDNEEGTIIHVGLIMEDHHIIHAHGKVRIDRLDQSGIYNSELRKHTHKLRVIKKMI